jgi:hypothetical protein
MLVTENACVVQKVLVDFGQFTPWHNGNCYASEDAELAVGQSPMIAVGFSIRKLWTTSGSGSP